MTHPAWVTFAGDRTSRHQDQQRVQMENGKIWPRPWLERWSRLTRGAPGKETSPVRRRPGWPGIAVKGRRVARRLRLH
jgi:hypothetical protein